MKIQAIIPLAGVGSRLGGAVPKPLVMLAQKPLGIYALQAFEASPLIQSVILVVHPAHIISFQEMIRAHGLHKVVRVAAGGAARRDSVYAGVKALDEDTEFVVVHDGARPFITQDIIARAVKAAAASEAAVAAVPVKSTIKRVDADQMTIEATMDRRCLWEAQTPQIFRRDVLCRAHEEAPRAFEATDDASLVELLGVPVSVFWGDYKNIKVTTPEDMLLAQALLVSRP